jgi:hypothetical protein
MAIGRLLRVLSGAGLTLVLAIVVFTSPHAQGASKHSSAKANSHVVLAHIQGTSSTCSATARQSKALNFNRANKANTWLLNYFKKGNIYSPPEREALDEYSKSSIVNSYLRGTLRTRTEAEMRRLSAYVTTLDSAITKGPLCGGVIVWRGFGSGWLPNNGLSKYRLKFINDPAFLSTSLLKTVASNFATYKIPKNKPSFLAEIYLPPGLAVASPTTVSSIFKGSTSESELLLPRDTNFEVVSARKIKAKGKTINYIVLAAVSNNGLCYCTTSNKIPTRPTKAP